MSWNELFDFAQAVLGYTAEEAQEYAHRKILEQPLDAAGAGAGAPACVLDASGVIAELRAS